ncbi:hypothetical protein HMPREF1556_00603 [Porphyromonas sp. oral taxon 278 str. W7784]|nr:hypothetical protein HMPREF1556_00603 [Porphyromonas sp. oral taxon 278 str. W7784]
MAEGKRGLQSVAGEGRSGGGKKRPTVGRRKTYCRSPDRPPVGRRCDLP